MKHHGTGFLMRCRTQQAKVEGGQYVIKRVGLNKKLKKTIINSNEN